MIDRIIYAVISGGPLINGDQDARSYKKRALVNGALDDLSNKKIER